jgi:hypothetical protein
VSRRLETLGTMKNGGWTSSWKLLHRKERALSLMSVVVTIATLIEITTYKISRMGGLF